MRELNIFDKFLYKLIIGLVLLLTLVSLNEFNVINLDNIKNEMDNNINMLTIIQKLNGRFELIDLGENITEVSGEILDSEEIDGKLKVKTNSFVSCYITGVVVKIEKEEYYTITVLGIDDIEYVYENLETIDVHIYSYLKTSDKIGKCNEYYYLKIGS